MSWACAAAASSVRCWTRSSRPCAHSVRRWAICARLPHRPCSAARSPAPRLAACLNSSRPDGVVLHAYARATRLTRRLTTTRTSPARRAIAAVRERRALKVRKHARSPPARHSTDRQFPATPAAARSRAAAARADADWVGRAPGRSVDSSGPSPRSGRSDQNPPPAAGVRAGPTYRCRGRVPHAALARQEACRRDSRGCRRNRPPQPDRASGVAPATGTPPPPSASDRYCPCRQTARVLVHARGAVRLVLFLRGLTSSLFLLPDMQHVNQRGQKTAALPK